MSTYEDILDRTVGGYWQADSEDLIAEHLDFIEDIDISEPDYSFDLLRVYVRKSDGMILWATDSGCSCPSPFEDVRVSDLRESTLATFEDAYFNSGEYNDWGYPEARVRASIRDALTVAKVRGAR